MTSTKNCPLCNSQQSAPIYEVRSMPVFQNKVYPNAALAINAPTSRVILALCESCSFVYNAAFDPKNVSYDSQYENEQAYSTVFQNHLSNVIDLFIKKSLLHKRMIEIGCGKGYFLEKLIQAGCHITGFDPAYTGQNPNIIKKYFNRYDASLNAEIIILRHILEHIQHPLDFLHDIGKAFNYNATIYIEVPSLEWIIHHDAFWDIFYEHCNYFSLASLTGLFEKSEQGFLFDGQYFYIIAHLKDLKIQNSNCFTDINMRNHLFKFGKLIDNYRDIISNRSKMAVWGAGAKGVTFTNLIDPDAKLISRLVDINPKKQYQYIAKSAHQIIPPAILNTSIEKDILVMNDNYYDEIQKMISSTSFNLIQLKSLIAETY